MVVGVTTITIEWNEEECADRNGDITSYSVRYGLSSTPSSDRSVNDTDSRTFSVGEREIGTSYSFEVAAVNGNGIGPYSTTIMMTIPVPSNTLHRCYSRYQFMIYIRSWILPQWSDVPQQQYRDLY